MPKTTLVRINYWDPNPATVCDECEYETKSATGMKLHRRVSHGKLKKYYNSPIIFLCGGCRVPNSRCKCKKK